MLSATEFSTKHHQNEDRFSLLVLLFNPFYFFSLSLSLPLSLSLSPPWLQVRIKLRVYRLPDRSYEFPKPDVFDYKTKNLINGGKFNEKTAASTIRFWQKDNPKLGLFTIKEKWWINYSSVILFSYLLKRILESSKTYSSLPIKYDYSHLISCYISHSLALEKKFKNF